MTNDQWQMTNERGKGDDWSGRALDLAVQAALVFAGVLGVLALLRDEK